jgi:hypothetical protein
MSTSATLRPKHKVDRDSAVEIKRLNLKLTVRAYEELRDLSRRSNRTMTELVRLGIGLVKIAIETSNKGHKIVVATEDGKALKELVLPT